MNDRFYRGFGLAQLGLPSIKNPQNIDEKIIAERQWLAPTKPSKPQLPCDVGLFGDDHLQLDLVEMLQEPTNEE